MQQPVDVKKPPTLPSINVSRSNTIIIVAAVKNHGNIVARVKELWLHNNNTLQITHHHLRNPNPHRLRAYGYAESSSTPYGAYFPRKPTTRSQIAKKTNTTYTISKHASYNKGRSKAPLQQNLLDRCIWSVRPKIIVNCKLHHMPVCG